MNERSFTERDLRRWAEQGLISPQQLQAILEAEAAGQEAEPEAREGLNGPTILYYLGASLALTALGVFGGVNWQDASEPARLAIIAVSMGLIAVAGYWAWRGTPYKRGGSALLTIAVAMMPLLLFSFTALFSERETDTLFDDETLDEASALQLVSLAAMIAVLLWTRLGMISLAVSGQAISLTATASAWWLDDDYSGIHAVLTGLAALLIAVGFLAAAAKRREEGFWFSLAGYLLLLYAFTAFTMSEWHAATAALYLAVGAAFVLMSVPLRQLPMLLLGVGLLYAFLFRLVADTFEGSPLLPVAIAFAGLSMILLAMGYQRFRQRPRAAA